MTVTFGVTMPEFVARRCCCSFQERRVNCGFHFTHSPFPFSPPSLLLSHWPLLRLLYCPTPSHNDRHTFVPTPESSDSLLTSTTTVGSTLLPGYGPRWSLDSTSCTIPGLFSDSYLFFVILAPLVCAELNGIRIINFVV